MGMSPEEWAMHYFDQQTIARDNQRRLREEAQQHQLAMEGVNMYQFSDDQVQSDEFQVRYKASNLFTYMHLRGCWRRLWMTLTGRSHRLLSLRDIKVTTAWNRYGGGKQIIPINRIRGSEGRCRDFDINFHPLHNVDAARWHRVATAWLRGIPLPPVELIQMGEDYYVRDGHHRISVARAMGQQHIDAVVIVWQAL
jgi:hypothetical protein